MEPNNELPLAFIKYEGDSVKEGFLDARKSGEVLIGIDELLRHFIYKEFPDIKEYEFELPVRVQKGSWEVIFSQDFGFYAAGTFALWMAGKYVGGFLEQVGKNDANEISLKEIFKNSIKKLINVIKLAKHLNTLELKIFENVSLIDNNEKVKVRNDKNEEIILPIETLDIYKQFPKPVFNKLTRIIEDDRKLIIGLNDNKIQYTESINNNSKGIFSKSNEENVMILPELKHGDYVELEIHITRANENTNNIGVLYNNHILTCFPMEGNIKDYKNKLFSNCLIKGYVERLNDDNNTLERKPYIRFVDLELLEDVNPNLFDE